MGYWVFSLLKLTIFLGMFILALCLFLPKAVTYFTLWKKGGKPIYLSASAACLVTTIFLLAANFIMFIKVFIHGAILCIK